MPGSRFHAAWQGSGPDKFPHAGNDVRTPEMTQIHHFRMHLRHLQTAAATFGLKIKAGRADFAKKTGKIVPFISIEFNLFPLLSLFPDAAVFSMTQGQMFLRVLRHFRVSGGGVSASGVSGGGQGKAAACQAAACQAAVRAKRRQTGQGGQIRLQPV